MRFFKATDAIFKLAKKNQLKWDLVKQVMKLKGFVPKQFSDQKEYQEYLLRVTNKQLAAQIAELKASKDA